MTDDGGTGALGGEGPVLLWVIAARVLLALAGRLEGADGATMGGGQPEPSIPRGFRAPENERRPRRGTNAGGEGL